MLEREWKLPNGKVVKESDCNWFDMLPCEPQKQMAVCCTHIEGEEKFFILYRSKPSVN